MILIILLYIKINVYTNKEVKKEEKQKYKEQVFIKNCEIVPIDSIVPATKSLCKIIINNQMSSRFLIKLFKGDEDFYCLMTNEHSITQDMIKNKEKINFYYDNENRKKEIYLNKEKRYIKYFTDINIDVTVIEILKEDKIEKEFFLLLYIDYIYNKSKLKEKEITIIQ